MANIRLYAEETQKVMETNQDSSQKKISRATLFRYTPEQEARIKRAIHEAVEYMKGYGKGRQPRMIDTSHYDITGLDDDTD